MATLLGAIALGLGVVELAGRRVPPLQCDRETPQRWLRLGPPLWALLNGTTLGVGAASRIGFWLWYVVPAGALLVASPAGGAAVFGFYGTARGMAVWVLMFGLARWVGDRWSVWLIGQAARARRMAAFCLTALGVAVTIAVGF